MLDPSVVLNPVGGVKELRHVLNPTAPDVIVEGSAGGASVAILSGSALTAPVGNDFQPSDAWAEGTSPITVDADTRRAFKQGGPDHVPIVVAWA
jgi:hypothetical protein